MVRSSSSGERDRRSREPERRGRRKRSRSVSYERRRCRGNRSLSRDRRRHRNRSRSTSQDARPRHRRSPSSENLRRRTGKHDVEDGLQRHDDPPGRAHRDRARTLGGPTTREMSCMQPPPRKKEFKVFVGNLPFDITEDAIRRLFTSCGKIESLSLPLKHRDPADENGNEPRGRGFAFLGFGSADSAAQACMLTGTELHGRQIVVDLATPPSQNSKNPVRAFTMQEQRRAGSTTSKPMPPQRRKEAVATYEWGMAAESTNEPAGPKAPIEKPNFEASGNLDVQERTTANGTELKFEEPDDARKPSTRWRLYVFKNGEALLKEEGGYYKIHRQSGYLFGRDRKIADIPVDHPSCSKQHAVLQYRKVDAGPVKPYLMDLDSINGSFINGKRLEGRRYYELVERDMITFGTSTREYVILHDNSRADESEGED